MNINEVLESKKSILERSGNPLEVPFTIEDINVLGDTTELRRMKISRAFPAEFEPATNLFDCARRILAGDSCYRVLELCVLRNRVLRNPVCQVFPQLKRV